RRLAWLALRLTTVPVGGSRTRSSAVFPVTVAPLLTLILVTPSRTWKASPKTVLRFPPLRRMELGVATVPRVATIPWIRAVIVDPASVSVARLSTDAPLPSELTTLLLTREMLLPAPETNNPLAPGPLAVIVE